MPLPSGSQLSGKEKIKLLKSCDLEASLEGVGKSEIEVRKGCREQLAGILAVIDAKYATRNSALQISEGWPESNQRQAAAHPAAFKKGALLRGTRQSESCRRID